MSRKHFTADMHFAHRKIAERRGYTSTDVHDAAILEGINATVRYGETLWMLGDVFVEGMDMRRAEAIIVAIKCTDIRLIRGNHDLKRYEHLFTFVHDTYMVRLPGRVTIASTRDGVDRKTSYTNRVFLSHYPHVHWDRSHKGAYHVYGHLHAMKEASMNTAMPGRRAMDVGVDNQKALNGNYQPFSEDDLLRLMEWRPMHETKYADDRLMIIR